MEAARAERRRVAVFGGTFDPPHVGHLMIARELAKRPDVDEVLWMLARKPPHKPNQRTAPAGLRLQMVLSATDGVEGQVVSSMELAREGPSYTVDTLRRLRAEHPEIDPVLILGVDQFAEFSAWKEPEEVTRLAPLWVSERDGRDPADVDPGVDVEWTLARVPRVDVSSSEIRRRIREKKPIRHLVPRGVAAIIEREGLYRG